MQVHLGAKVFGRLVLRIATDTSEGSPGTDGFDPGGAASRTPVPASFELFAHHEIPAGNGIVRAHGSNGAFEIR